MENSVLYSTAMPVSNLLIVQRFTVTPSVSLTITPSLALVLSPRRANFAQSRVTLLAPITNPSPLQVSARLVETTGSVFFSLVLVVTVSPHAQATRVPPRPVVSPQSAALLAVWAPARLSARPML